MKTARQKFSFGWNRRSLAIFLFLTGLGFQVAGTWLPSLVTCYKGNEKPRIEFMFDVCDCRQACPEHVLAGLHECAARWRNGCIDVPLLTDPGCGPLPRLFTFPDNPDAPARRSFAAPLPSFLCALRPEVNSPPPWRERASAGPALARHPGGSAQFLCRFLC